MAFDLAALDRVLARGKAPSDPVRAASAVESTSPAKPKAEDLRGFAVDELRRAAYPDEWADIEGNPEALAQFAASLRATGLWAESCALTAAAWALPEPDEESSPVRPVSCSDCRFWMADRINPAAGLGACNAPLPERERLQRCPTPWPWQTGCPHGRPAHKQVPGGSSA